MYKIDRRGGGQKSFSRNLPNIVFFRLTNHNAVDDGTRAGWDGRVVSARDAGRPGE